MKYQLKKGIIAFFIIAITAYVSVVFAYEKKVISVGSAQSDSDATHSYYLGVIKLALSKINNKNGYKVTVNSTILTQGRSILELERKNGLVNIYQTGTNKLREQKLIPIRVPLLKGTLGYRIPVIHKDNVKVFDNIKSIEDLSTLVACQGEHWPDSDILEENNLKVLRNANFHSMYLQVQRKYCDYFLRAIIEAYPEIAAHKRELNDLLIYDKLLIMYPFPMYFFVSPHSPQLALDIEKGLRIAIEDGSFDDYFRNNEKTKHLFPLQKWKNAVKIKLSNKLLPEKTPVSVSKLWITLD